MAVQGRGCVGVDRFHPGFQSYGSHNPVRQQSVPGGSTLGNRAVHLGGCLRRVHRQQGKFRLQGRERRERRQLFAQSSHGHQTAACHMEFRLQRHQYPYHRHKRRRLPRVRPEAHRHGADKCACMGGHNARRQAARRCVPARQDIHPELRLQVDGHNTRLTRYPEQR